MTEFDKASPVFIHSLFRSGSTYLFKSFRRLGEGYTCFQEPLHEITLKAAENPALLIEGQGGDKVQELRHPQLDTPYFTELYNLGQGVMQKLTEAEVYNAWFAPADQPCGIGFWRSLIEQAPGRPVIQECRSAGRIKLIREQIGGYHAFLWRNPIDQWWSYQVSPYFDLTTQLVLNGANPPPFVQQVAELIGFIRQPNLPLEVAYDWYFHRPLAPDQAYQGFYALWLLTMHYGLAHADLMISIDSLSTSQDERQRVIDGFAGTGVRGLDFSDCQIPASWFSEQELAHFASLEEQVHQLWVSAGMSPDDLSAILELRQRHAPAQQNADGVPAAVARELARYRDLINRKQQQLIEQSAEADHKLQASHRREDNMRDELARQKALVESQVSALQHAISLKDETLNGVLQSTSWRITAPLRAASHGVRLLRERDGRARLRSALMPYLVKGLGVIDRLTSRFPRVRGALLSVVCRVPFLFRIVERVSRHRHAPGPIEYQVHLSAGGREIYHDLTAEMERYKSLQQGKSE